MVLRSSCLYAFCYGAFHGCLMHRDTVKAGVSLCYLDGKAVFPVARIPADALPFTTAAWQCNLGYLLWYRAGPHGSGSVQSPATCALVMLGPAMNPSIAFCTCPASLTGQYPCTKSHRLCSVLKRLQTLSSRNSRTLLLLPSLGQGCWTFSIRRYASVAAARV